MPHAGEHPPKGGARSPLHVGTSLYGAQPGVPRSRYLCGIIGQEGALPHMAKFATF